MQLFYHDVGQEGAKKDFPKTIFGDIAIAAIEDLVPPYVSAELNALFPSGFFNAWGVPAGASSTIKQLTKGDAMLLIRTTAGAGDMPVLCSVKAFWQEAMPELSDALWGNNRFPFVFFFETQFIELTWDKFKQDVGYGSKFFPRGRVFRVSADKLSKLGGAAEYVATLTGSAPQAYSLPSASQSKVNEDALGATSTAGTKKVKTLQELRCIAAEQLSKDATPKQYFTNVYNRSKAVRAYVLLRAAGKCEGCEAQAPFLGKEGTPYLEPHHTTRLADGGPDDPAHVIGLCPNCHRRVHHAADGKTYNEAVINKLKLIEQEIIK